MKCFIYREEEVLGPFNEQEIKDNLFGGDLIWVMGSKSEDWLTKEQWEGQKDKIEVSLNKDTQTTEWYLVVDNERFGPMPKSKVINTIKDKENLKDIYLWNKNLSSWTSVYKFKDILNEIGLENRKSKRLELNETVILTTVKDEETTLCKAISLSSEGLGVLGAPADIHIGDEINVTLSFIEEQLTTRCKVVFKDSGNQSLNLKFSSLQGEAKSLVVSYLNEQSSSDSGQMAA